LRAVFQVARAVDIPVVGIGGIATLDDVMEFLVAGATAVQIGTANFYNPGATMRILDELPAALAELGASRVADVVGSLQTKPAGPAAVKAAAMPDAGKPAAPTSNVS
jgi:dihydroorotate dehydrogenase (NAD+) catalytic subunit